MCTNVQNSRLKDSDYLNGDIQYTEAIQGCFIIVLLKTDPHIAQDFLIAKTNTPSDHLKSRKIQCNFVKISYVAGLSLLLFSSLKH